MRGILTREAYKFQFTPLREGRQTGRSDLPPPVYFNSRPSARGDGIGEALWLANLYFNSRPSARGDVKAFLDGDEVRLFQFTPLREGRRHVP